MSWEWTQENALWEEMRQEVANRAINTGTEMDFSQYNDEQIFSLCNEEILEQMNFVADMSDSESTRIAERERNEILYEALVEEANLRGWQ